MHLPSRPPEHRAIRHRRCPPSPFGQATVQANGHVALMRFTSRRRPAFQIKFANNTAISPKRAGMEPNTLGSNHGIGI